MALVQVTDVAVLNNPARFTDPFQFEIQFECLQELSEGIWHTPIFTDTRVFGCPSCTLPRRDSYCVVVVVVNEWSTDIEWKITYVGSAESEKYDQELDSVLVGPVPVGCNKFVFQVWIAPCCVIRVAVLAILIRRSG